MGLSRMQGTAGYIGYYNEDHGKLTRRSCHHYNPDAQWCMKSGKRKACKNPTTCVHHSEQTHTYIKQGKSKKQKKRCEKCCFYSHEGTCLANAEKKLINGIKCVHFVEKPQKNIVIQESTTKNKIKDIVQRSEEEQEIKEDVVSFGDRIKLLNMTNKLILDVRLVGGGKENKYENKISIDSLLGRALENQKVGTVIIVEGITYKILKISERRKGCFSKRVKG